MVFPFFPFGGSAFGGAPPRQTDAADPFAAMTALMDLALLPWQAALAANPFLRASPFGGFFPASPPGFAPAMGEALRAADQMARSIAETLAEGEPVSLTLADPAVPLSMTLVLRLNPPAAPRPALPA
ncbi:hypothetical protein CKO38_15600, partial [Rhodospirillum rubrum]|uniref:hypothetical protein n=2 Tax=Rhodospirillum rubrum TaxID=1085 RepID=UPI00190303B3